MSAADDIRFYLSGGTANTDPAQSLGGARSTTLLARDGLAWAGAAMAGVTLIDGTANPATGALHLTTEGPDRYLDWQPSDAPEADRTPNRVRIAGDGTYWLHTIGRQGAVRVSVIAASLGADETAQVAILQALEALFASIDTEANYYPTHDYRCLYARNDGAVSYTVFPHLPRQPLDGSMAWGWSAGATADTIGQTTDTPPGVTFRSNALWQEAALGDYDRIMAPGAVWPIWLRRQHEALSVIDRPDTRAVLSLFCLRG